MVSQAIKRFLQPVIVQKLTERKKERGKFRETFASPTTVQMTVIPVGPNDILIGDNGSRVKADKKFYVIGISDLPSGSILEHEGVKYEIRGFLDRFFHGDYTIHFGKRRR